MVGEHLLDCHCAAGEGVSCFSDRAEVARAYLLQKLVTIEKHSITLNILSSLREAEEERRGARRSPNDGVEELTRPGLGLK